VGQGAAIINAFDSDASVLDQARTGPDVFIALMRGVSIIVIILQ